MLCLIANKILEIYIMWKACAFGKSKNISEIPAAVESQHISFGEFIFFYFWM